MIRSLSILAAALLVAVSLAGCGKQGDLERPAPLWSAKAKAEYAAQKRQQADVKTKEAQGNTIETLPDEGEGSNPFTNPAPPRTVPIPGQHQSPTENGQPGAFPNPYATPQ